jgi:hypothetical protein
MNNLPALHIILLEIYFFFVYNFANTSVNSAKYFVCKASEKYRNLQPDKVDRVA